MATDNKSTNKVADRIQAEILKMADGAAINYRQKGGEYWQARSFEININGICYEIDFRNNR